MSRLRSVGLVLVLALLAACDGSAETGTLRFNANGEDFVRQGFTSKDGWQIAFDHVYITVANVTAYQTDPPYDAHSDAAIEGRERVELAETVTVDLAEGDEDAVPLMVGEVNNAPAGHFNALSFDVVRAEAGPAAGYALVLIGTAAKDGESVAFTLNIPDEYTYSCGEYVGDSRKGILAEGGTADVEMTFHFDHIFGDAETPPEDSLNTSAPGFDPLAALAVDGVLTMDRASLQDALPPDSYDLLAEAILTLAHVGEGHCNERPIN
jgi:hypothetical protein